MLEQMKSRWKGSPTEGRDCPWENQWSDVEESIRMQISTPMLNSPIWFVVIGEWQTFPAWLISACRLESDYHLGLPNVTVDLWRWVVKWCFDFFWSAGIVSNKRWERIGKPLWTEVGDFPWNNHRTSTRKGSKLARLTGSVYARTSR